MTLTDFEVNMLASMISANPRYRSPSWVALVAKIKQADLDNTSGGYVEQPKRETDPRKFPV